MNERIKSLLAKAHLDVMEDLGNIDTNLVAERFAELIVKECLDQCYNRGMNDELYAGQLKAAAYIEEHFGVEE